MRSASGYLYGPYCFPSSIPPYERSAIAQPMIDAKGNREQETERYNPRMALSRDQMRDVIIEHVEAENDHSPERVIATYSRQHPAFEDVAAGVRYEGGDAIVGENYRHLWDGFPGLKREILRWTFGDDAVVIELRTQYVRCAPRSKHRT